MIVLGGDPGTSSPGIAVVERVRRGWNLLASPVLHDFDEFLEYLVTCPFEVECVCTEALKWTTHAKRKVEHGNGSGQILLAVGALQLFAKRRRVPFVEVHAKTWRKRVSGSGNASKEDVRRALYRGIVLNMPEGQQIGLNRSDAIALAIAGAMQPGARKR